MSHIAIQEMLISQKVFGIDNDGRIKLMLQLERADSEKHIFYLPVDNITKHNIEQLFKICCTQSWEDITGRIVRMKRDDNVFYIGHRNENIWMELNVRESMH